MQQVRSVHPCGRSAPLYRLSATGKAVPSPVALLRIGQPCPALLPARLQRCMHQPCEAAKERGTEGGSFFGTSSFEEDTLEMAATRQNLQDALAKIKILTEQVAIVDELQLRMVEQDDLIAKLRELIETDAKKQESEKEELRAQLQAADAELQQVRAELELAQATLSKVPNPEQLQGYLVRLEELELALADAQAQVVDLERLRSQVQFLEKQLRERESSSATLQRRLDSTRQDLVAAQAAAGKAMELEQEARVALARKTEELAAIEADVENMRKTMAPKGKRTKNFKQATAAMKQGKGFSTPALAAQDNLREQLKQAQEELESLQGSLEEREAQLQAAQSAVDFLTSQCKEQEQSMQALQAQVADLQQQLKQQEDSSGSSESKLAGLQSRIEDLQAQVQAAQEEKAEAQAESDKRIAELQAEAETLRTALLDMEEKRNNQETDLGMSLGELRAELEASQQLKVDLAILADAFGAKEMELEATLAQLAAANTSNAELSGQLEEAKKSLLSLQGALKDIEATNIELVERVAQLEKLEGQLAAAQQQVMGLKTEISSKTKLLSDTAQKLTQSQEAEAGQRSAAEALSAQLAAEQAQVLAKGRLIDELKAQVHDLTEQVNVLRVSDDSLRRSRELLAERNRELEVVRTNLAAANADRERALQEAATLRTSLNKATAGGQDVDRLRQELARKESIIAMLQSQTTEFADAAENATVRVEALMQSLSDKDIDFSSLENVRQATQYELRVAQQQMESMNGELQNLRAQVAKLTGELAAAQAAAVDMDSLLALQAELAEEAQATLDLLGRAERMVVASASGSQDGVAAAYAQPQLDATDELPIEVVEAITEARQTLNIQAKNLEAERARAVALEREVTALQEQLRQATMGKRISLDPHSTSSSSSNGHGRAVPVLGLDLDMAKELEKAKDAAMSAQAEAQALQKRVSFLEREMITRDRQMSELRNTHSRGNRQAETLARKLQTVEEENTKLKQAAARQQQLLTQTRLFFEKKAGQDNGNGKDSAMAAATKN